MEDIALVVDQMSINLHELFEYIKNVDPVPCVIDTPKVPIDKPNSLNILRSGDSEMIQRPSHFHEHFPSINIVSNGEDNIKNEPEDPENTPEARAQNTNSSFKLPALFPKEELLSHRNNDDDNKGVSFGNSAVQMDKFGNIRVSGTVGKTASSKPPVFNTNPVKPPVIKQEPTPITEPVKSIPPVFEKSTNVEIPKTPPIVKKMPSLTPIEFPPSVHSKQMDILAMKKDKKEKKKKKLLLMQEKQQRKQMKQMQKAMALGKDSLIDNKPHSVSEETPTPATRIAPPSVLIDDVKPKMLQQPPVKPIDLDPTPSKIVADPPPTEFKPISIPTVKVETTQKITSEPDKNKLNIFKKIPVKKDMHPPIVMSPIPVVDVDASPIDNFNLPFGTTITPAPMEPLPVKDISPSKMKDVKDHGKSKESGILKSKEHTFGKVKEKTKEFPYGKSKDFQMINTENNRKDDVMSSFAARAMMSIIGKSQEGPPPTKVSSYNF